MVSYVLCVLHSNPDHYSTSRKCSGVDMNMARILFHRVIQQDHPEITQQVRSHKKLFSLHYISQNALILCTSLQEPLNRILLIFLHMVCICCKCVPVYIVRVCPEPLKQ